MIPRSKRPFQPAVEEKPKPEMEDVEVTDYDFHFSFSPAPLCVSLFDGDTLVDDANAPTILIQWNNGIVTTIYRSHLLYTEQRKRTVPRPKKVSEPTQTH